jgi:transcriptional regulator
MYNPAAFQETDRMVLRDMVRGLGAGELITFGTAGIEASILPVLIDDDAVRLTAHLARANRQWRNADLSVPALVTFRGPDAYVSPGYYPSKQEHGKVVPTWNYITVQARGHLTIHDDPIWTRALVERLTRHHEQRFEKPWSVEDAPADFIDGLVKTIVGLEIEVTSIEGKWKLSQNRPEADRAGVRAGLQRPGATQNEIQTATAMSLTPR